MLILVVNIKTLLLIKNFQIKISQQSIQALIELESKVYNFGFYLIAK